MEQLSRVKATPDLVRKEALAAMIALALLSLVSALADAPVQGPADPSGIATEDVKAPWIFLGVQQMLRFFPPLLAGVALPLVGFFLIMFVPYIPARSSFQRSLLRVLVFGVLLVTIVVTLWGYLS
ncbi:MAG: hypothetical protein FJ118_13740 [Deltaproteobacteria bacterium]|nr:hypothetical protein [Deltaproteobacteria bacterium]